MKTYLSVLILVLGIATNGHCQKLGNMLEKAKAIKEGANKIGNEIQNIQENNLYTHNTSTDRVWKTSSKVHDAYCGLNQSQILKTNAYFTEVILDNGQQITPCEFVVGPTCITDASEQALHGTDWMIMLTISKDEKEITIARWYSEKTKKDNPAFANHPEALIFTLGDSTITCKGSSTLDNLKAKKYDLPEEIFATFKSNNTETGEGNVTFENSRIYQLDYINWKCSFKGSETHAMKLFIFQIFITLERDMFAKHLKDYENKQAALKLEQQHKEFISISKECTYCNTTYTGVSYNFDSYRSTNNPCGDTLYPVYYKAFCSRKCALEHCKATHP